MQLKQTKAILRSLRVAPRKTRLLIDLVRGMKVDEAINQLQFSKKEAAGSVLKLLNSAIANALHNHGMKKDTLVIKTAFVDGGKTLHRWIPRAMGRATSIRKRTSHITIILEGEAPEEKKVKKQELNKIDEIGGEKRQEIKKKQIKSRKGPKSLKSLKGLSDN